MSVVLPHSQQQQFQLNDAIHDNQFTFHNEVKSVSQLAPLASQHHTSDYNRLKFGPKGCPIIYTPLSVHMPDYVTDLQARQAQSTQHKSWWPCNPLSDIPPHPPVERPVVLGPGGASTVDLQEELSAAISESITQSLPAKETMFQLKTSDTHPINISMIIPIELIPILSSYLVPARNPYPTLFDVPPSYTLDWVTNAQFLPTPTPPPPEVHQISRRYHTRASSVAPAGVRMPFMHLRTRSAVTEALQAAISSGLAAAVTTTMLGGLHGKSKGSVCDQASLASQKDIVEHSKTPVYPYRLSSLASTSTHKLSLFVSPSHTPFPANTRSASPQMIPTETTSILKPPRLLPCPSPRPPLKNPLSLGNLLLSSCPGKKVRLTGPVKGRGGVCRDVRTDMRRMRGLGVQCIICCLDDAELEFLGAPWDEYVSAAGEIGMDVLRIPTPEGLTPLTPCSLDQQLTHLIKTYTLQGMNMLVHCRGGVGRAGLIGCCWLLRLGLCGWIETGGGGWGGTVRRDTLQLVERAISVMRKRRSVKAVETYEQVKFLVDYADYLRDRSVEY